MTRSAHGVMPRILVILAVLFAAAAGGCAAGGAARGPDEGGPPSVAVWDFDDLTAGGETQPGLGELLAARAVEAFQAGGKYAVVERQRLLLALEELHLGSGALADESTRLRLGRMTGARYMVFGGFQVVAGRMRLDLRMVEVETGKVRKAVSRVTAAGDLPAWLEGARAAASEIEAAGPGR